MKRGHPICVTCWMIRNPTRGLPERRLDTGSYPCCFCDERTAWGLFVRASPGSTPCRGKGGYHEMDEAMEG